MSDWDKLPKTGSIPSAGSGTDDLRHRAPKARLVQLVGEGAGSAYRLQAECVIGRDPSAQVCVEGDDISRRHARIWREASTGEWMIEDLGSKNGVQVNGVPVAAKALCFGDHIQIGASVLFAFTYFDQLEQQILQVQRMEAVGALAGGVAHDFNNLLSVVIGNLDFMEHRRQTAELDNATFDECVGEMRQAAGRGEQLIRQLFRFSRLDSSEGRVPTDVTRVVREAASLCRRTFGPRVRLRTAIEPGLVIHGDPPQIHQMVMNLLINARDAMPAGGDLDLSAELVTVSKESLGAAPYLGPGRYVLIRVSDTGEGMSTETRLRVFEPFFSTKEKNKGTGLGLSTVFALVRSHGGHVHVESELRQGTTFSLYLPALDAEHHGLATARVSDTLEAEAVLFGAEPPKVLVVDDDGAFLRTTGRLLREFGYKVVTAGDGRSALDLYAQDRSIELVVLDLLMPEMDGEEVMRLLRERDPAVKILLISGRMEEQAVKPLLDGARGFLAKPCGAVNLRRAIEAAILASHTPQ